MPLRRQMILLIAGTTLVIYVVILGIAAVSQYRQSKGEVEQAMLRLAVSYSERFDGYLREAVRIADTTARVMESDVQVSDDAIYALLKNNVLQTPLVYGSAMAFEPGVRRPAGELFSPYVCRTKDGTRSMNIDQSVYDWYRDPRYTWFTQPKRLGHGVWSEPYFDEGAGNILMSTYSAPFRAKEGFGGVVTVDIDLPRLRETVGRGIDVSLDFVILASDGRYVYSPEASRIMARPMLDYVAAQRRDGFAPLGKRMLSGELGAAWIDGWDSDEPLGVFYAPIPSTDWAYVARVPATDLLRDVRHRTILNGLALVAALLLIVACVYYVAGHIAAPIAALERGVMQVSEGNLEAHVDESASTTEVRNLAHNFNRMTSDLRANLDRLAIEIGARQRMERDLDIARQIQQGLLPTVKPDVPQYDIAGWSHAANKAGGDYFDWQTLPDGRILVSLADVTGHGIGPALVAAVCRAYARATTKDGDLGRFMDRLNELLIDDLPEGRFITYVGVLIDPQQHWAQMLSAGHGPLFRCVRSSGALLESGADGIPLGLAAGSEYGAANQFALDAGDSILLITDGLFEWPNAAGERFGLDRLRDVIRSLNGAATDEVIHTLYDEARQFVGDMPQEDDVTIVVIRRRAGDEVAAAKGLSPAG